MQYTLTAQTKRTGRHWASENPEIVIATASSEGLVTAKGIGSVVITATLICTTSGCDEITATSQGVVEELEEVTDPGQVTDLRVVGSSSGSIAVAFTEVDDGAGDPASYALRYGSPTLSWGSAAGTEVSISGTGIGNTLEYEYMGLAASSEHQFQLVTYRGTLGAAAAFGKLSNVASGSTEASEPASVSVWPSSASVYVGHTVQFKAEARDEDGNVVPGISFEWSSSNPSIATIDSEGLMRAQAAGTTLIVAATMCGALACESGGQVTAQHHDPSEQYPNQPAGFQPWFEHDWQSIPPRSESDPGRWAFPYQASGVGYFTSQGHFGGADNAELIDDPDAPHGYGKSLRITIPEGQRSGTGIINWSHMNTESGIASQTGLNPYYISYWILFEPYPEATQWSPGGDWEFGRWRTFTVNRHLSENRCRAQDIGFSITGGNDFLTQSPMWWVWGNPDCSTAHTSPGDQGGMNIRPGPTVGVWYHVEFLYESLTGFGDGDHDSQDVAIKIWINGELGLDRVYQLGAGNPLKQLHINHNASWSWGESSSPSLKDRADYLRITGIYVSGVPYDP